MAAMACLPALSQTRMANRGIGVEDVSVTRDGGYVMLNMKLNLDSLDLPTNTRLVYTPVIKTKEGQVEMPEIVINGRRQQIMYERGDMKKDVDERALVVRRRNGKPQTVAYQGGGRQLGVDTVLNINRPAVDGTMPMLTVYLDIDREAALRRRAASSQLDRIEQADDAFRTRTEAAYHELIRREPERFIVVDAAKPAEKVSRDMTEKVIQRLMEAEA